MTGQIGQPVKIDGKLGTIINISDKIQVKFSDGTMSFYDSVDAFLIDTRLKTCPYCKEGAVEVKDEEQRVDKVYQCMKCSQRFTSEESNKSVSYLSN